MRRQSAAWLVMLILLRCLSVDGQSSSSAPTAAVQRANERYGERGLRFVIRPVEGMYSQTCLQAGVEGISTFTEYYYRHNLDQDTPNTCDIYFTNTCMDYLQLLCLSSEWNAFFFNNGFTTLLSAPPLLTPAYALILAGSEVSVARTLWGILNYFSWSHVTLLLDTSAATIFYSDIFNAAKALPLIDGRANSNATVSTFPFQSTDNASMVAGLLRAQENSRVFLLFSTASVAYTMMDLASQLGMTNGEYVFFNVQPAQTSFYGKASLFNNPTPLMLNLTWNLIFITFHESDGTDYERTLNGELRQLAHDLYNVTYEPGFQPLSGFPARMAYTSIELISRVLADNLDEYRARKTNAQRAAFCAGDHLATLFFNQTFALPHTNVTVDASGLSSMDVDIWMFDSQTKNMSVFAVYRSVDNLFKPRNNSMRDWPTGSPPLDVPLCGFSGLEGPCRNRTLNGSVLNVALPVAVVFAVGILVATWATIRKRTRSEATLSYWWLINEKELDGVVVMGGTEVKNPVIWRNTTVWLTTTKIQGRPNLPLLRQLVSKTAHPNVNALLGVVMLPHKACILSSYCKRGSLPTLLEAMKLDADFQLSMARDLAKGLVYLHNSIGRAHGCLCSECCLIDDHFTLRIGRFGFAAISNALSPVGNADPRTSNNLKFSAPDDIYASGQIFLLIVYQSTNRPPSQLVIKAVETDAAESEAAANDVQRG
ncbi:atrial natriuretic peptide receptor 1-like [Paramacrobiotus metropolitanus]|uniref:atrial natriuretic peptide receptor 1-like n=1 Tax=Paramacrobiotus metropolitanus TaxID=2943436 RepID=UPI00244597EE|nr:atrial natriuretic peptide receptor 1-like [Paramacrobiotus metropolitanus]